MTHLPAFETFLQQPAQHPAYSSPFYTVPWSYLHEPVNLSSTLQTPAYRMCEQQTTPAQNQDEKSSSSLLCFHELTCQEPGEFQHARCRNTCATCLTIAKRVCAETFQIPWPFIDISKEVLINHQECLHRGKSGRYSPGSNRSF